MGFTIIHRKSRRLPAVVAIHTWILHNISLLSDSTEQAQELLHSVERECKRPDTECKEDQGDGPQHTGSNIKDHGRHKIRGSEIF